MDWLRRYNLRIKCAIFDGTFETKKSATRLDRRAARVKTIQNVYNTLKNFDGQEVVTSAPTAREINGRSDPFSIAPFRDVLIACLQESSVEVLVAGGEADKLLATVCKANENTAILSSDSDFFIFGVSVALMSSLNYSPAHPPRFTDVALEENKKLVFHLFTASTVADCLRIPSRLLPHLSVVCGNDFVEPSLALIFAKSKRLSGAIGRVGGALNVLRSSKTPESDLKSTFRVDKAAKAYDEAIKIAISAYTLDAPLSSSQDKSGPDQASSSEPKPNLGDCPLPEPSRSSKIGVEIWGLHRSAAIPPCVVGLLKDRYYWNPLLPEDYKVRDGGEIENKFFNIRCAFYLALYASVPTSYIDKKDKMEFTEVNRFGAEKYELDMKEKTDVALLSHTNSIEDLGVLLGFNDKDKAALRLFPDTACTKHKAWATILKIVSSLGLLPKSLYRPLLTQFAILQQEDWIKEVSGMAPILPSIETLRTGTAIVVAMFWLKLLNVLVGSPLGKIDSSLRLFDGHVFALLVAGKLRPASAIEASQDLILVEQAAAALAVLVDAPGP